MIKARGTDSDEKLGLRTRGREPLLQKITLNTTGVANQEAGAGKQKKKVAFGRKRSYNELKKAQNLPQRTTRSSPREGQEEFMCNSDSLLDADQSNLKLSASKRAKTDNYMAYEAGEGILSKLFESPFGMIRRMWSGLGTGPADGADKSPKD